MRILFMCVANSARSQIAEGLAKVILPTSEIASAGSHPTQLNPLAVKVLLEDGIDITKQYSKSFESLPEDFRMNLDYVITLCADEVCPMVISNAKRLHWPFPDPASKSALSDSLELRKFQDVRNSIRARLLKFKSELENQT